MSNANSDTHGESGTAYSTPKMVVTLRYNALSTVTSFCAHMQGPPLDVLRRAAEQYMHTNPGRNKGTVSGERKTKWWVCLVELNILFYQYLGDTRPRFATSIADASAVLAKDSAVHSVYLTFPDRRKWMFDFETVIESKRFVFAVCESKRATEGTSIFFKHTKTFVNKFSFS